MLLRISSAGITPSNLEAILITHLHGDHVYGLPGLVGTMSLAQRKAPLRLIGPKGLEEYLRSVLQSTYVHLDFELHFEEVDLSKPVSNAFALASIDVSTLPLRHRIPAVGYLISNRSSGRSIRKGVLTQFQIPFEKVAALREGEDYKSPDGSLIRNEVLTLTPKPAVAFAYFTDTCALDQYPEDWPQPELLIHDSTFSKAEARLAAKTGHATAEQAAVFAAKAGAKKLLLTHISPRYDKLSILLEEAREHFPDTEIAVQGHMYELQHHRE